MNALVPANCTNTAQAAAKAALIRRVEAASRANDDRQDAPRGHSAQPKAYAPVKAAQPLSSLAAQIIGALEHTGPVAQGYDAYVKASRLLELQSHRVDVAGL
jgi:hypothetical protein